jgi:hypothetical protein
MVSRKSTFYLTREELIREIILSKKVHRESNYPRTPAECFTANLTRYLQLMVNRYANKGQWRNYCVDEKTECLTHRGWMGIDDVTEHDTILSYQYGQLKWSTIKSIYRGDYAGKLFHLTGQRLDALVTPEHKFLTTFGLKTVDVLQSGDKLILFGDATASPAKTIHTDNFVELQKNLTMPFILSLSQAQRKLLINQMIAADGWITNPEYQNYGGHLDKEHIDAFVTLCTIAGFQTCVNVHNRADYDTPFYTVQIYANNTDTRLESIDFHGGKNPRRIIGKPKSACPNTPTVDYIGRVWCPETEYGLFIARRNGYIYLTGNSYLDDMKSDALLTLCQNAFKYNEEKYDNPFGYYTQIIKYCFITFLEKEEVIRDIKDSLWESIGMTPSYARQIKNEMLREVNDTSNKGLKALKRDVDAMSVKIAIIGQIASRVNRLAEADGDIDREISEALELEPQSFTSDRRAVLLLFDKPPEYMIQPGVEIAGSRVNLLSLTDHSTNSSTKRILPNTSDEYVTLALCSIALTVHRDLMVKKLREISGYNLNPRFTSRNNTDSVSETQAEPETTEMPPNNNTKHRKRRT